MRKQLSILFSILTTFVVTAQTPKFINYQGIARDASGNPIVNQSVSLNFTITNGSSPIYTDSKLSNTNAFGLFNTSIGSNGNPITSNLSSGNYSLIVSINNVVLSPQNLASVPYALHAETASSAPAPTVNFSGGVLSVGGNTTSIPGGSVYSAGTAISISSIGVISNLSPDQTVTITSSGVATVNSTYPTFNVGVPNPSLNFSNATNILTLTQGTFATTATLTGSGSSTITITGTNNAVVSPTAGSSFLVNVPTQSFSIATNTITSNLGGSFVIPTQSLSLTGNTLTSGPSSNSVNLSSVIGNDWSLNGNTGTVFGTNSFGTNDFSALSIVTNSLQRIGINTSTISGAGGVVIGGNTALTSLGKDLTLQGPLSSTSDLTYGHMSIRGGSNSPANQSFLTFSGGPLALVRGYLGDRNTTDDDITLYAQSNLRLSSGSASTIPTIFISGTSNNVAIGGFTAPLAKLDVQTTHTAAAVNGINNGATSSSFAYGVYGETNSSSAQGAAVKGNNAGVGLGVAGVNLTGSASADAHGVYGETNSTNVTTYGVFGRNSGTGSGVYGRASSTAAINASGVYGQNIGIGSGVYGINTGGIPNNNAHGVLGITQNTGANAAGVFGSNDNVGPSIFAQKNAAATGNALRVENLNSGNGSPALNVSSNSIIGPGFALSVLQTGNQASLYSHKTGSGTGSAAVFENLSVTNSAPVLQVVNGSSVQMSPAINAASNSSIAAIGVQLQNAHLKSIGNLSGIITHTYSFGGFPAGGYSITPINCTDVKGTILIANTSFTTTPSGAVADFVVPFNKSYGTTPIVVLTQQHTGNEISKLSVQLLSTGTNDFTFRLVNLSATPLILVGSEQIKLNYFVIE
jgi:hypothetical protein